METGFLLHLILFSVEEERRKHCMQKEKNMQREIGRERRIGFWYLGVEEKGERGLGW